MTDHFNTGPGLPQTKAEVDALTDEGLDDFMAFCEVEPADFDGCLACYAYMVAQGRQVTPSPPSENYTYVCEGWWHPNTNAGRVHDHPENPGRNWSVANHRLCEQVYTRRKARS